MQTEISINHPEMNVIKVGFATPIYEIAHKMYGWAGMQDKEYYDDHKKEKEEKILSCGATARQILIDIGMKFREIYGATWLDYCLKQKADVLIITDLRFPNEALQIKEMGGTCINVLRNVPEVTDPKDPDNQLNGWTWDMVLLNDGTKQELNKSVVEMVNVLLSN